MKFNKVYVVLDNSVWNDEDYTKIVGVTTSKEVAKNMLKQQIFSLKEDVDFDNLEFSANDYDDGYIVDQTDESFELFLNGEYNSYHSCISIIEKELVLDKEVEEDLCF